MLENINNANAVAGSMIAGSLWARGLEVRAVAYCRMEPMPQSAKEAKTI